MIDSYVERLLRVARKRYTERDMPVPLTIIARLSELGVYFEQE
jgi:hypothetical protein